MKAAFNQNDLGLYPVDDESIHDCEGCIFLSSMALNSYKCILLDFGEEISEILPHCAGAIFTPEPLSNVFKL